jgi:hypothetical protein
VAAVVVVVVRPAVDVEVRRLMPVRLRPTRPQPTRLLQPLVLPAVQVVAVPLRVAAVRVVAAGDEVAADAAETLRLQTQCARLPRQLWQPHCKQRRRSDTCGRLRARDIRCDMPTGPNRPMAPSA